ncbi:MULTISPECIES: GNAT family N-acetyltransferase [Bacillus]|uniref:N-acetyltransferase n=2 Tax=Bacillus cereus group TaxID=86661 RepID=A0A2A7DAA2_BACAN|nr:MULTISPECIES: GNAT family N-acetyltransferase [Bacillus]MCP1163909.1 GNAT family N-acetyltransferase [Bacillus sp. 1813sda1]MDC7975179.1 GNAT family N-acetyltransferase [Bacillus sp. BLCC-B18]OTW71637.1 GNAT family N-acetyltransferase [Bacillus thuringiensis serovar coreanensis]OTX55257.1 GNAT family N-acetyltransferase [Bacillus thuringiensis serovar sooncheon]OTX58594.1 GNAT family N-acetyltransferase [Bacillus thuringiensis serovar guiyangiensis]
MEIIQLLKKDDLFNKAIDVFWKEWGEEGGRAFYEDCMTNALTDPNDIPSFYIAKVNDKIIGTYALIRNDLNSRQDLSPWLACLFVDEKFRGNSIGAKLLNHGLLEAAKRGYQFLYLTSDLKDYYEKYGWEKIGVAYGPSGGYIPLFKKETAL